MDELQRAQRLLNSPIEGDHRKAIKLLAKSGDRRALALLRQAYDNAQSAETKQLALKGGAYLKENLHAEVLAPAADPITFDLPEDNYGLDGPDTPAITPKQQKRQNNPPSTRKTQYVWYILVVLMFTGLVCTVQPWLVPWINIGNLSLEEGNISLATSLSEKLPNQYVRPAFSNTDFIAVLTGKLSPWQLFLSDDQIAQLSGHATETHLDFSLSKTSKYSFPYENWITFFQIMLGMIVLMSTNSLMLQGNYPQNKYFAIKYRHEGYIGISNVLFGLFEVIPAKILWLVLLGIGIILGTLQVFFLFSIVPRFLEASTLLMNLDTPSASPIAYLDYGFFIATGVCLTILIGAILGLTSSDTPSTI